MPGSRHRSRLFPALLILLGLSIALAGYLLLQPLPFFAALEGTTLDWRQRLRGPIEPAREIVLLTIDDRSLEALGRWPLSRADLAGAIEALAADGARVIAVDLLIAEAQSGTEGPAADRRLAEAIAEASRTGINGGADARGETGGGTPLERVVLPFALLFNSANTAGPPAPPPPELARAAFPLVLESPGSIPGAAIPGGEASGAVLPLAGLAEGAAGAHVNVLLDSDGVLREQHPALSYGDRWYPSLPVETLRLFLGLPREESLLMPGRALDLGARSYQLGPDGGLPLAFYGPAGSFETWSFIDLLEGRVPPGSFAGRIVLIGTLATGSGDTFATAFSRNLSGVEVHATALANLLAGPLLLPPERAGPWNLLAILLLGLLAAGLAGRVGPVVLAGGGLVLLGLLYGGVLQLAFLQTGLLPNLTFPLLSALLCFGLLRLYRNVGERRLRREAERQRRNLARYVPRGLEETLAGSDRPAALDRVQSAAVMFIDLVGFTSLNEQLSPAEAMALLRDFHGRFGRAVQRHGGIIGAFIGDGAMAAFGLLESREDDARRALACAQDFAADIQAWSADLEREGRSPMRVGIGLHYGPVQAGEIGGQFTAIGDTVNVASRLQGLTRHHACLLLASDELLTAAALDGDQAEAKGLYPLPDQEIRGRVGRLRLWGWAGPGA